jgi:hypothetical protein
MTTLRKKNAPGTQNSVPGLPLYYLLCLLCIMRVWCQVHLYIFTQKLNLHRVITQNCCYTLIPVYIGHKIIPNLIANI